MDERPDHRSTRCAAICADRSPCRAWALRDTQPPSLAPHGGGRVPVAAPMGNHNARTHGYYARRDVPIEGWTLETLIADVAARHERISGDLERLPADAQVRPAGVASLFAVYAVSTSRLEALLREDGAHDQIRQNLRQPVIAGSRQQPDPLPQAQGPTGDDPGPLFPGRKTMMNQETISPPHQTQGPKGDDRGPLFPRKNDRDEPRNNITAPQILGWASIPGAQLPPGLRHPPEE